MNIDKDKWPQVGRARIATGVSQFPSKEGTLKADGGRHRSLVRILGRRRE